jgi:hypothetical protein
MGPTERLALSWGNARQFTKLLLSLLSHIGKMVGRLGFAPSSRRLRAGTSLSKFATLGTSARIANAKVELNHRSQVCEALTGTGVRVAKKNPKRTESGTRPLLRPCGVSADGPDSLGKVDGHESNALSISVWKTDVCLSTPMPEEMESRVGIAPTDVALQSTA